jgi:hypothetical protein
MKLFIVVTDSGTFFCRSEADAQNLCQTIKQFCIGIKLSAYTEIDPNTDILTYYESEFQQYNFMSDSEIGIRLDHGLLIWSGLKAKIREIPMPDMQYIGPDGKVTDIYLRNKDETLPDKP